MLVPHELIKRYRLIIIGNVWKLPLDQRTLQVDIATLQEIIRTARPGVEKEYGWYYQWGAIPRGQEWDALIEEALVDLRACRALGEPETYPERYLMRVDQNKPKSEQLEDQVEEREAKENSPERRTQQAGLMQRLRARVKALWEGEI